MADFVYKCTDFYAPEAEHGILWNDPSIGIDWPAHDYLISEKDTHNQPLNEMDDLLPVYRGQG
jgi:dTDP-4-dehydrorhamnose 3,5-epimerase